MDHGSDFRFAGLVKLDVLIQCVLCISMVTGMGAIELALRSIEGGSVSYAGGLKPVNGFYGIGDPK